MKKVVILCPTYNEKGFIADLIDSIFSLQEKVPLWELNLLIIDSHSKDGTIDIVKKLQKKYSHLYLLETEKEGLGKAYLKGFKYCEEKLNPFLIMEIDGDGQHDPNKIPEFLKEIEKGADFVVGTRYSKGGSIPKNWGLHRKVLSIGANMTIKLGFMKLGITEWTNGYRAIKFWLVKKAFNHLKNYSGYVFQVAFMDFAIKNNAVMAEIPVDFKERHSGVSKINAFQYSSQTFLYVFTHSPFIKYVLVGLSGFAVDFGISYIGIEKVKMAVWVATVISSEMAIVSNFLLNNYWSFAHKKLKGVNNFILSFLKFNLVSSGSVLIQAGGIQGLALLFGKKFWYIYKVLIIAFVIIPYSYILYNKFIWKNKS